MKAAIFVYSGTGNTLKVAEDFKSELVVNGLECDVIEVLPKESYDVADYDYVGIAYPIHAFNPPKVVDDFVKNLNSLYGKKAFIIKTSGEPHEFNNASSAKIIKRLKKERAELVLEAHLLMPYNIMFRHKDELVKKMLITNGKLIKVFSKDLIRGRKRFIKCNILDRIIAAIFRIEWYGAPLIGKGFKVSDECNGCGACVKNCKMGNIEVINGKAVHKKNCNLCMNCASFCPKNAVKCGILKKWKVYGGYDFKKILSDDNITVDYLSVAKDFMGIYKAYFANAEEIIKEAN